MNIAIDDRLVQLGLSLIGLTAFVTLLISRYLLEPPLPDAGRGKADPH